MYRLFLVPIVVLSLSSCSDTDDSKDIDAAARRSTENYLPQQKPLKSGYSSVEGISFNIDSITNQALLQYNKIHIETTCKDIVENMLSKNKKLESDANGVAIYGFEIPKYAIDSLKYYNYSITDIGYSDKSKTIYIVGHSPYKERGIWDDVIIKTDNFELQHPELYKKAVTAFINVKKPKLINVTATDQASKYIDYTAEYEYADGVNGYIYFTVKNENQKLAIALNKSEN